VARRADADALSGLEEPHELEGAHQPARRFQVRFSGVPERAAVRLAAAWRASEKEVACGAPRRFRSVNAMVGDPLSEAEQRRTMVRVADDVERDDRLGVARLPVGRPRQGHLASPVIDGHNAGLQPPRLPVVGMLLLQARVVELGSGSEVMLLGRDTVPPVLTPLAAGSLAPRLSVGTDELEPGERRVVGEELVGAHAHPVKELPVRSLVLAPVP
jgi:hypothetical protein